MSFKLEEGFTIISREGQIGIYFDSNSREKYPYREEAAMVEMILPPRFCWELKNLGVLRTSEFETIAMLYPQYFNEVSLVEACMIAERDGLAVVNVKYPNEQWR